MNPLYVLSAVLACAYAAPAADYAAPAVAAVAPAAYAAAPLPAPVLPAPYTTTEVRGAPLETVHQAPAQVRKELHYGQTQFVSGYASQIHKPATPVLPISVPTVLKGSVATNPAIVKTVKEPFVVQEPYTVEKRVERPYDVPVVREQLVEVPVPVHVDRPYAVEHPVPVAGEPIVNVRQTAPIVQRTHTNIVAQPAVYHNAAPVAAVAAAPVAAVAAAPAYAAAPVAAVAAAPVAAVAAAPVKAY